MFKHQVHLSCHFHIPHQLAFMPLGLWRSVLASLFSASVTTSSAHAMERLNAINGDSFQPFRPLNCGSAMLLLFLFFFSFSCNFYYYLFCLCVWQVCCCGTFICLSPMAMSHYHNTELPTIDRECLFKRPGHSSSPPYPTRAVCLALPHFHVCPLAIGLAAVPFQPLAFSQRAGLTHCVKSFCPWGSQRWAMEKWLSPVSTLALMDGYLSPQRLRWPKAPLHWC